MASLLELEARIAYRDVLIAELLVGPVWGHSQKQVFLDAVKDADQELAKALT